MKRITSIFLAVVMLFSCLSISVTAVGTHSTVTLDSKTVEVGDIFDVYINISGYSNINTIGLKLTYDPAALEETTDVSTAAKENEVLLITSCFMRK